MPYAAAQSGPDLAIVLDQRSAFMGGETVSGHVLRKSHFVDPNASVVVRMFGRFKIRAEVKKGISGTRHRHRFYFFDDPGQKVHHGPVHIPPDGSQQGMWPFAITLPRQPDLRSLRRDDPKAKTLVPLDEVASGALPASFYNRHKGYGISIEVYAEYYLQATLRPGGKNKPSKAIRPFTVRPISSPDPIPDFAVKNHFGGMRRVVSLRLVPGTEDAELSLGQKVKKAFGSSQLPVFAFSLGFDVPSVLQMGNPDIVPFQVRLNPLWDQTSEILQNTPPMIVVQHFTLKLQATTHYAASKGSEDEIDYENSVVLRAYNRRLQPSPASAATATDSGNTKAREARADQPPDVDTLILPTYGESPSLDLGTALGIKVRAAGRTVAGSSGDSGIYSTFMTCNIKHEHYLVWELVLAIGGETAKFDGKRSVTLMGPSYDQEVRD